MPIQYFLILSLIWTLLDAKYALCFSEGFEKKRFIVALTLTAQVFK
jgi:hypothetical protein